MDIIYYDEQVSFCLQTRTIAQIAGKEIQSKMLKKEEASLLFLLLTKDRGLITYQDAEQATQAPIDHVRHVIMPGLNTTLAVFHLEIVAVQGLGFVLFPLQ